MSNIDDLDRLVAVFMKQEDEHFSLFNYIQAVNQETDQHLEKTEELEVTCTANAVRCGPAYTYIMMAGWRHVEKRWHKIAPFGKYILNTHAECRGNGHVRNENPAENHRSRLFGNSTTTGGDRQVRGGAGGGRAAARGDNPGLAGEGGGPAGGKRGLGSQGRGEPEYS